MKNKKIILGLTLVAGALMFTGCGKKQSAQPPAAPVAEDFVSSSDAGMTQFIISDINEICAQSCDGGSSLPFYSGVIFRDTVNKKVTVTYSNTKGADGKIRNGVLMFNFASSTNNAKYYRQPGYIAVVTSTAYTVDGYAVDVNSMSIKNITPSFANAVNPAKDSLTWTQTLDINVWKPNDPDKITAAGTITKQLLNTNSTQTFTNIQVPINWKYAWVGNYGSFSGVTSDVAPYKAEIEKVNMIKRNYQCAPDKIPYPEKHPNIIGLMVLDIDPNNSNLATKKEKRYIDYGIGDCDYNTTVTIRGVSYSLDIN